MTETQPGWPAPDEMKFGFFEQTRDKKAKSVKTRDKKAKKCMRGRHITIYGWYGMFEREYVSYIIRDWFPYNE